MTSVNLLVQVTYLVARLVGCCLTAQTGYIVPQEQEIYYVGPGTRQTHHKTMKQYINPKKS